MKTVGDDPELYRPRVADQRAAVLLVDRRRDVEGGLDALRAQLRSVELAERVGGRRRSLSTRRLHAAVHDLLDREGVALTVARVLQFSHKQGTDNSRE